LYEITQSEADALLLNEAYPALIPSARHERRMKALFARHRRNLLAARIAKYAGKAAAILFMALGIAFAAMLLHPQVRGAVRSLIIHVYETFIRFDFPSGDGSVPGAPGEWHPEWLPDGYALAQENQFDNFARQIYANADGGEIMLVISVEETGTYDTDNEHRVYNEHVYNGIVYHCGQADADDRENQVIWLVGKTRFNLEAMLDMDILLEIAKSVKK